MRWYELNDSFFFTLATQGIIQLVYKLFKLSSGKHFDSTDLWFNRNYSHHAKRNRSLDRVLAVDIRKNTLLFDILFRGPNTLRKDQFPEKGFTIFVSVSTMRFSLPVHFPSFWAHAIILSTWLDSSVAASQFAGFTLAVTPNAPILVLIPHR